MTLIKIKSPEKMAEQIEEVTNEMAVQGNLLHLVSTANNTDRAFI